MNKPNVKMDVLKKAVSRFIKNAPAKSPEPVDPLTRIIMGFLEYDCDAERAEAALKKIQSNMVDNNELRVTPAIELAALLGVRYPFAESRCSALHRTLNSIFDREHHMRLERLGEMKKSEIRPYFQSLAGISPYVEAAVCVDCFDLTAAPVDLKLLLYMQSKDILPEDIDLRTAQQLIEKCLKAGEASDFFHGSRKEIDGWSPKVWPAREKASSPILGSTPAEAQAQAVAADLAEEARKKAIKAAEAKEKARVAAEKEKEKKDKEKSAAPAKRK